jgi:DNA-binding NarL/FixJ family response regulator
MCRYEQSVAHLQRGIDVSRSHGQGHLLVGLLTALASSVSWLGRLDEAHETADAAVEAALLAGNDQFLTWALTSRCSIALLRGEVADAVRAGQQAASLSRGDPVSALAGCAYGAALIEAGEPATGRDTILAAAGGRDMPLIERPFRTHDYEPLVRAEIALGDLKAAARWVELADDAAAQCPELGVRQSEALRARAELLLAGGDPAAAADRALAAAAAADANGTPIEGARARLLAGRALAAAGDAQGAATLLEVAISVLGPMGAQRYCDAATRELRRLGRRTAAGVSRKRARAANGALSPRELEIAELVTVGKTNRQIAAELFLSEKTIETHLSHVFAKLGVRSRAAVAAELASAQARQPA